MKLLLWSMSLACFLPAAAGISAQAKSLDNVGFETNSQELSNRFGANPEIITATNEGFAENFFATTNSLNSAEKPAKMAKVAVSSKNIAAALPLFVETNGVAANLDSVPVMSATATKIAVGAKNMPLSIEKTNEFAANLDSLPVASTKITTVSPKNTAAALPLSVETSKATADLYAVPTKTIKVAAEPNTGGMDQPATAPQKATNGCNCATGEDTTELNNQLDGLRNQQFPVTGSGGGSFNISPAISINNPVGFGADRGIGFVSADYQARTRYTNKSDGELGFGVGLFDATDAVGLELSYTVNSFGTSQGFGSGGFNAKLHKRFGDAGLAIGWNRFANIQFGSNPTDYPQNSYYAVATQVIRTGDDIDGFLSRIALSAGVGGGQFVSQDTINRTPVGQAPSGVNAFGSAAFRLAKPLSAIVEWTGQDLAAGLSITPFDNFPLVITPAFRDISGISGESARFVVGVGTAWQF
jgi:hypothetical protein